MAVVITVVNLLVILVLPTTKTLTHSQSIYKLSLAVADFLVGILVLPTCFYNICNILWHPLTTSRITLVSGYVFHEINETFKKEGKNVSANIYENLQNDLFPMGYINSIGFMTTVSLFVSIYTLAAAGLDRLSAIYKPLSNNKAKSVMFAKIGCVICWAMACIFALIPIFTPPKLTRFEVSYSLLAVARGTFAVILYAFVLLIPLTVIWIVNIMVYQIIKKHSRTFQSKFTEISQINSHKVEKRLAATLRLMVGVFTFTTLSLLTIFLLKLFFLNVHPEQPTKLDPEIAKNFLTVQLLTILHLFGNSFCNFFIYNIKNKEFQTALRNKIKAFVRKQGS